jgi:integrase
MMDNYIFPTFGKIKLQDLSTSYVQRTYNSWKKKSPLSKNPLSVETIRHINRIFTAAMNKAVQLEYIKKNPLDGVSIKYEKGSKREVEVYNEEEFNQLLQVVKGTDMELPVALLFDCMLRRGELLALKWDSINFDTNMVTVQRTYIDALEGAVLKEGTKTNYSCRKIKCTDYTMKLLKQERSRQMINKLHLGVNYHDDGFVICQENGLPFAPKSISQKWRRTLRKNNLRHIKLHATRNCSISFALASGMAPHTVMKRAGHSNCSITMDIYAKVSSDQQDVAAQIMSETLFKQAAND